MPLLLIWQPGSGGAPPFDPAPFAGLDGEPFEGQQLRPFANRNAYQALETGGEFVPVANLTVATVAQQAATFGLEQQVVPTGHRLRFAPDEQGPMGEAPPGLVSNVTFDCMVPFHTTLTWTDPPAGSSPLASVQVWRGRGPSAPFDTVTPFVDLVATVAAGVQTFDDYWGSAPFETGGITATRIRYYLIGVSVDGVADDGTSEVVFATNPNAPVEYLRRVPDLWYDHQVFRANGMRWVHPDQEWHPTATGDGPAPFDATALAPLWQEQPTGQRPPAWRLDDAIVPTDTPPPFDNALIDFGRDAQQDRWTWPRWFAPDAAVEGDIPRASPGGFDPATVDWGWDAQLDRSTWPRWFTPDLPTDGFVPLASAFDPNTYPHGWDAQLDRSTWPRWFTPDQAFEGLTPPIPPFDPTLLPHGWDAQTDRSTAQRWFTPDQDTLGIPPFNPTTASVAEQAGLWQDSSPQQDRTLWARWYQPEDATEPIAPYLSLETVASVPEQAPLWIEQPGQERSLWPRWYNPSVEPVDGPLQDWLFTTGAPGGGTGSTPAILINAENGDVFLSIGGNFIVPAS